MRAAPALAVLLPALAAGGDPVPASLTPSVAGPADRFGTALAVEGDLLAVGAVELTGAWHPQLGPGFVALFRRTPAGWTEEALLTASDGGIDDAFGAAVAVDGGRVVVGAPQSGPQAFPGPGKAYVFERVGGSWTEVAILTPPQPSERFGSGVAIAGDRIVVGQPDWDGSAWDFRFGPAGWTSSGPLVAVPPVSPSAEYGATVAMHGDLVVVGAPTEDSASYDSGAAYVFRESGGSYAFEARLEDPGAATVTNHAAAVAVWTDGVEARAVIGSREGRAFVWERTPAGWVESRVLTAFDDHPSQTFGEAVAVAAGRIVVGAPYRSGGAPASGAAHVFEFVAGRWSDGPLLHPGPAADSDRVGAAVGASGDLVFVGSPGWNGGIVGEGRVLAYDLTGTYGSAFCAGRPNSSGASAALVGCGSAGLRDDDLGFAATGLPPGALGFLLAARAPDQVPALGGGDGDLCLASPLFRFSLFAVAADSAGRASVQLDLAGLPPGAAFVAGDTWRFQWWYRDANPGPTSNTSHGLVVRLR